MDKISIYTNASQLIVLSSPPALRRLDGCGSRIRLVGVHTEGQISGASRIDARLAGEEIVGNHSAVDQRAQHDLVGILLKLTA